MSDDDEAGPDEEKNTISTGRKYVSSPFEGDQAFEYTQNSMDVYQPMDDEMDDYYPPARDIDGSDDDDDDQKIYDAPGEQLVLHVELAESPRELAKAADSQEVTDLSSDSSAVAPQSPTDTHTGERHSAVVLRT